MENKLLAALSEHELQRLMPLLTRVSLAMKQVVYRQNELIDYVYFPATTIVSSVATMEDGSVMEVATVGNEGMVGLPIFLRTDRTTLSAYSQVVGDAYRMTADDLRAEVQRGGPLVNILLRYTEALLIQIAQGSACNQLHTIRQRCARWLLMTHDRVGEATFAITQEFLCQMLAVRRATVSEIASSLQEAGLIRYSRGKMTITDRQGLQAASCECYNVIRLEYERALAEI
ncbi:MAG: transcriptional regulator, Crp/Fnr family [Bryobacterales bacterium]|nr:transcriptional regulator, Crp/Fnr family [Bryobacterales bacterium]